MASTIRQNVDGELLRPIGMRRYAYWPQGVVKAVFSMEPSSSAISI